MTAIIWPERFTPGTTDNYVSTEIVVPGLTALAIVRLEGVNVAVLINPSLPEVLHQLHSR